MLIPGARDDVTAVASADPSPLPRREQALIGSDGGAVVRVTLDSLQPAGRRTGRIWLARWVMFRLGACRLIWLIRHVGGPFFSGEIAASIEHSRCRHDRASMSQRMTLLSLLVDARTRPFGLKAGLNSP